VTEARWIREAVDLGRRMGFSVKPREPMSRHTSFQVGGPADILADPSEPRHVQALRSFAGQVGAPFSVIGAGSNLIVRDGGVRGIVCRIGKAMSAVAVNRKECTVSAQAGARLRSVCTAAEEAGLTGLEFAVGIPGVVGGAVMMNAGAHGGCIADAVEEVLTLGLDCRFRTWRPEELDFGYRRAKIQGTGHIVLSARFGLAIGDRDEIHRRHAEILAKREGTQPLTLPSAGSVFRRPPGTFAGKLIEECGLKGTARAGGAMVSEKHAGFIVNAGGATAKDILELMAHVQQVVLEQTGIQLEPEVIVLGEDLPATDGNPE
jgi:UDP-N-acetylmuramate dehydrogenase